MASVQVWVSDATGSRRDEVELPDDAEIDRVIAALIEPLQLPLSGPDGQPMSYRFHHSESQTQLRDKSTLASSGVKTGDTLRLVPEIMAG
jgi:hypothetical protein